MKKNLPISQKKKFKYSITFQSFDEESLEAGDSFDSGYEIIDATDFIGDILYKAYFTYGIYMPVAFGTWESTNPLENTDYWEKGIKKYFAIHISNEDETKISKEESDFITFLLSDGHYELNKFREYAVGGVVLGSIALGIGALITYFYFKGKKGGKSKKELVGKTSKSVTYKINGKDRKFPIKDAWKKEHTLENQSEDYEVPQAERFEMGGDASEHYHEIEYGEGGIARAKDIITKKIGWNEENANYLVSQSEKFSIWLADSILKKELLERGVTKTSKISKADVLKALNEKSFTVNVNWISNNYSGGIREVLDWLQHPVTPKQNLKELSFDQALEKAREWHNELQVLGGDIDFTEPETHTILKKYPVNSDGIEYYWVFIPSNYCDLESSRMGHCGRTGYGNKLISLRSVKAYGKGHTISDSHVTIAYGSDGTFYQVKGKKNNKPSEKYFPYIFDLIKGMLNNDINKLNSEKIENINSEIEKINKGIENIGNELALIDTKSIEFKAKTDAISFLVKEKGELEKSLEKIDLDFNFNGFGSEYGAEEDYGFEDMTKEEIREIFDLKPTLFQSAEDNYMLLDAGVITVDEFKKIVEREPDTFSSFGNRMKLYDRGIITEQPSTTFELKYDCDYVYRLLDIDRDFSDDLVSEILCGDIGELSDGWSYYRENPSDLVSNLNKENEQKVIDEIVRITKLDESVVKKNGIEYYLKGEDENFSPNDDFDNIIRALASAQNQADNNDYYKYLYDAIESALNELGEVHFLNNEGVKMTIDLSNSMTLEEIAYEMDDYNFSDIADLFNEKIGEEIDRPSLRIDDRYSPYGSSEDFNEYISDTDLEQGYKKGGVLRTKNISTNKKIKNMKSIQNKFDGGGRLTHFNRHISMDSETMSEILKMTNYPLLKEYFVEKNGEIKYDRIKSELKREGVSTDMINNYLSGLFDGYNYSNTDAFKKEMAKLKLVDKEFYDKVMTLYEKISKYPKINVEYADGGDVYVAPHKKAHFTWIMNNYGFVIPNREDVNYTMSDFAKDIKKTYSLDNPRNKEAYDYVNKFGDIRLFNSADMDKFERKMSEIEVEFAGGGRVTTNDGIIEAFLTSNRELKVGNLSTHYNQYDNQMLLRNYYTLIATRKGNDVSITNIKYSKTTTTITNKIRNIALQKRMNISYVDKFAEGGMTEHGLMAGDTIIGENGYQEDEVYILDKSKNAHTVNLDKGERFADGGETREFNYLYLKEVPNGLKLELTDEGINGYKEEEINDMDDLFEDIQANSEMAYIDNAGYMGFGLTEAPIITDGYYYDDMGEFTDEGFEDSKVYVWNDYMIKDLFATLMEQGSVVLTEVKSYAEGGSTDDDLIEYTIPTWAVGYLINDDVEGLTDEEIESVNKLIDKVYKEFGNASFMLGNDDESVFSYSNDIDSSGTEVIKLFILPSKNSDDKYAEGGRVKNIWVYSKPMDKKIRFSAENMSNDSWIDTKSVVNMSKKEIEVFKKQYNKYGKVYIYDEKGKYAGGGEAGYELENNIISGKNFKNKYATDFNGQVAKVIYTQNLDLGSNLGKGSYWNVTQDSLDIYSGKRDEELDSKYGQYFKNTIYKEIDDNLKIFVKDEISDELWDNEKLYNKIKNISDGIYDPSYDDYGLLLFENQYAEGGGISDILYTDSFELDKEKLAKAKYHIAYNRGIYTVIDNKTNKPITSFPTQASAVNYIKTNFSTLMEQGSVVLTEVKSYNYGGETFTEKYIESQGGVDYYSVDYDDVNAQEFRDDIFHTLEEAKLKFDELCENGKTFEDVPLDNVQLLEVYKSGEYQTLNSKMFYDFAKGGSTDDDRTQYKKAKSWKDIENHPLVDDTSIEENDPSEGKDYWVYLKNGYCWEFPNSEQHIIHEWGVKDTIREFNNSIYKCNCSQCVNEGKYKDGGEIYSLSQFPIYAEYSGEVRYIRNPKRDKGIGKNKEFAVSLMQNGKIKDYEYFHFDTEKNANKWVNKLNKVQEENMTPENKKLVNDWYVENDDEISELIGYDLKQLNLQDFKWLIKKQYNKYGKVYIYDEKGKYAGGGSTDDDRPQYKKAKSWKDIENHPLVDDTSIEENDPSEGKDYWVYLKNGYCWEFPNSEQHIIHEWGVKDTIREFNNSIYRCNCSQCVNEGKYKDGGDTNSPQKSFLSEKQLKKYNHEKVGHIDFYSKKVSGSRYGGITKEVYFKDGFRPSFAVVFEQEPKEVYEKLKKWVKAQKKNFNDIIAVKYSDRGKAYAEGRETGDDENFEYGGFVSKAELVWKKLSSAEKMNFLIENFTPQITPRSQEILVGKAYNFLPKEVKITLQSKYANVEEYAEGGETYVMTNDTYVNIFLSRGFTEKRSAYGLRFFEHKPTGIFITYDQTGMQTPVIISKNKSGEESIYEGNTIREVKQALDNAGVPIIKEGIDPTFAEGGRIDKMDKFISELAKKNTKEFSVNEYHDFRNKKYAIGVARHYFTDNDGSFSKFDTKLGDALNIDFETQGDSNKYAEGGKTDSYKFFDVYDKKTDKTLKIKAESLADAKIYAEESIDFNEYKDGEKINLFDWFWNYDYRHYLRDASPKQRNIVKQKFIEKGLELDASSPKHAYIVVSTIKPSELTLFKKVGSDGIKFAEGGEAGDDDEAFNNWWFEEMGEETADEIYGNKVTKELLKKQPSYPNEENAYSEALWYLAKKDKAHTKYAGGGEVEDWMEEALASLIEQTGNEDLDITMVSDNGNEFFAGNDMEEYRVFKTEEDAEEKAIEQVREDLEENPDYFNQDWLMNYIDGRDFFEQALNEMNYSYVEDIASETSGTKYNNRLIDELVENGLMDEDDAILENAEEIADELKYDYVLLLTEEKLDEGNNGFDYFINNFGEKETLKMVINNNLIDIDEVSRDAVNNDGIAHFISSSDDITLYLLNNNVAYRNN